MSTEYYRHCSTCKKQILYGGRYYKCSVSTCNRRPTAVYFCSVPCWDAHVPDARHRDAWAEEETAPTGPELEEEKRVVRKVVASSAAQVARSGVRSDLPRDVLTVVSKVKNYVKASADMNTSDGVSEPLSDHLRTVLDRAIESARANERKTLLARDIEAALKDENAQD
jgi:histone H3/H4